MKKLSSILIIIIMSSCYQWEYLYFVPKVEKINNRTVSKLHRSLYYNLTIEEIKEIKKLSLGEKYSYYNRWRYLKKEEKFIFIDSKAILDSSDKIFYKYGIYSKIIGSDEEILLEIFDKKIERFTFNPDKSKIFIEFYKKGRSIGIYSFPKFKLLKEMGGREPRWDKNTNELYYIRGLGNNSKLCALDENYKERVVYNSYLKTYRILNDSDILIVTEDKFVWYDFFMGRLWKTKYKSFLLSNPNKILSISPGSLGAVIKSLKYLKKKNKKFQSNNIREF